MTEDQLNPVDVLAEDFARRIKAGESPKIEEYAKKHPEHADTIRAMFPSIKMMERVSKQKRTEDEFERRTKQISDQKTLGDFVIRRELGRGGMGIVYEAVQQSLKRRVALKVLAPHIADSETQLKRFRREAKSAARLHHTNIVSVYGIGHADGLHFIAMQYIDGVSLQETLTPDTQAGTNRTRTTAGRGSTATAVTQLAPDLDSVSITTDDTPIPRPVKARRPVQKGSADAIREAARIIRDTADALAYAHEHGIQHRDIKPGNLLLDASGTVWVTDFGLAKHESDEAATKTGDIVGTLRYMAPEQFSGKEDARSDIYALGLTLYEMLTREPAYKSTKAVTLMHQKTNEPPPSPRLVVTNLPRDLETITLKASALDPKDRYQTARELETDLNLFLEDRPILSRRVTPIERLWRWTKRNPTIAGLGATTMALLATTAIVFAIGNYRTTKALGELKESNAEVKAQKKLVEIEKAKTQQNLDEANAANERTEATLNVALEAFDKIMSNISSRGSAQSFSTDIDGEEISATASVVTAADAELLDTLLVFFDKFSKETSTDLSHKTADAYARVGKIQNKLTRTTEAIEALTKSLEIYEQLAANSSTEDYAIERARIHRDLIDVVQWGEREQSVYRHYLSSINLLANNSAPEYRFELAQTKSAMAAKYLSGRMTRETIMQGGRGRGRGRGAAAHFIPRAIREFAQGRGKRFREGPRGGGPPPRPRGNGRPPFGQPPDGEERRNRDERVHTLAREAVAILTDLVSNDETNRNYRLALGRAYRQLADAMPPEGDKDSAIEKAIAEFEWLQENAPASSVYDFELVTTLTHSANRPGPFKGNARRATQAQSTARNLVRENPGIPEYEELLAKSLLMGRRDPSRQEAAGRRDAMQAWEEAVGIYRSLHTRLPSSFTHAYLFSRHLFRFSQIVKTDDPERARTLAEEAFGVLTSMRSEDLPREQKLMLGKLMPQLRDLLREPSE